MSIFPRAIRFSGTWRPYQQRVLNELQTFLDDRKIHIVAPPGSGKTTVGLEIIVRLGSPALILAPSITIREQWIDRFREAFLPGNEPWEKWISHSVRAPKAITVITYQALHSAYHRLAEAPGESDEGDAPAQAAGAPRPSGYADFDLVAALKAAGIRTVCMDEAHHLRSEWWKALEKVVSDLGGGITTLSLTATPPYDAAPSEWQRYIGLCGDIDAEIFTPELVREHNLCPHQDYIYFNWPEPDEIAAIGRFRENACSAAFAVAEEPEFLRAIRSHPGLSNVDAYAELFLDHPKYLTAMLVFLRHRNVPFSKDLKELVGTAARLPAFSLSWLEALLQGFLYDDCDSYPDFRPYQEDLRKRLSGLGLIRRRTVTLAESEEVNRLLVSSRGKLRSIGAVVRAEYRGLGSRLRLLVLTDYIRKDLLPRIGTPDAASAGLGVVPIFEVLRSAGLPGLKLGVLSGGVVIVPRSGADELASLAAEKGASVSYRPLNCADYVEADFSGASQKNMVSVVTEFFTRGGVHVLIGTKSLLGEGWDSPCINSLILASFVGSYMLSNQMRGRAIRTFSEEPDKTANIWHLVSMEPVWAYSPSVRKRLCSRLGAGRGTDAPVSEDFATLRRRFRAFLGVSYTQDTIEDGIDRISAVQPPYDKKNVEAINAKMLAMAADRALLAEKWRRAMEKCPDVSQIIEVNTFDKTLVPHRFAFFNAVACFAAFSLIQAFLIFLERAVSRPSASGSPLYAVLLLLLMLIGTSGALVVKYLIRMFRSFSPQAYLKQMGETVLQSLKAIGTVETAQARVGTENLGDLFTSCYLESGTTYEKNIFGESMAQLLGVIDNPRYLFLLRRKILFWSHTEYFSVPEIFGSKKENAEIFARAMQRLCGGGRLLFTRNAEGRKILLRARSRSFVNKNDQLIDRRRKVKTKWE